MNNSSQQYILHFIFYTTKQVKDYNEMNDLRTWTHSLRLRYGDDVTTYCALCYGFKIAKLGRLLNPKAPFFRFCISLFYQSPVTWVNFSPNMDK